VLSSWAMDDKSFYSLLKRKKKAWPFFPSKYIYKKKEVKERGVQREKKEKKDFVLIQIEIYQKFFLACLSPSFISTI
jgi:hypothetical protein